MRSRSAVPVPPRPFRKTPGWRQRKCIGDTIVITTTIGGIAGIIATITTIIIIATGTAGEADLIEINGPAHRGPYFMSVIGASISAMKPARLLRVVWRPD
jgi:hypothetical protein